MRAARGKGQAFHECLGFIPLRDAPLSLFLPIASLRDAARG